MKSVPGSAASIEVRVRAPFAVGVVLWRDETSRVMATLVAKATYHLAPGKAELVEPPDPIRHSDEYGEGGAGGGLRAASDLALFKPAHEVLVVGHLHPGGQRKVHAATARIVVGSVEKVVEATVPRRFDRLGELHVGDPQLRFPLRYELSARSDDNPVGIDATDYAPDGGHVLPQLLPPSFEVRPGNHVPLVALGPMNGTWPSRARLLRPEDRQWLLDPLRRPRPGGFDARYFCAAPLDQRSEEPLRADERLILDGLHPEHARLVTTLAGPTPVLRTDSPTPSLPRFVADTLTIDTDRRIVTLAFRAVVPLGDEALVLEVRSDREGDRAVGLGGDATAELDTRALDPSPRAGAGDATTELDISAFEDAAATALPFAPSSEPGRARMPSLADGTLPFRPASGAPPSSPGSPSAPPAAPRSSPSTPPQLAPPAPPPLTPPPPLASSVPQLTPPPQPAAAAHPTPPPQPVMPPPPVRPSLVSAPVETDPVVRSEPRDPFRRAFGGGSEPRSIPSATPLPPAHVAARPRPDEGASSSTADRTVPEAPAPVGVKAASDAAIAAAAQMARRLGSSLERPAERAPSTARRAIVDLLAFDPGVPDRVRRSRVHAPLIASAASQPRAPRKVDAPAAEPTPEEKARIDVLRVLSCGAPLGPDELHGALDELMEDAHDFEIPLLLVEGEVRPTMDEVETLRVAVELVKPLAGVNKRVLSVLALATEALARPIAPLPESAAGLYRQLEASTSELQLPSRHLAEQVDRTLLEARSFKLRTLLGSPRIRADLALGKASLPIYLPASVASQLPLLPTFPVAALVELRPREDVAETSTAALVAFALGRVLRARR